MGFITRKRGVFYKDGRPVSEIEQERCRKLGIPPAYTKVEVYPKTAKLQATAVDAQGKKHYYYHEKYLDRQRKKRKARATQIDFAKIKSVTGRILSKPTHASWHDALALRMIAAGYLRTGVQERETGALGAFQLKKKHVTLRSDGETVSFDFPAKSGQRRRFDAKDRVLHAALSKQKTPLLVGHAKYERVRDLLRKITRNDDIQLKDIRTAGSMQLFLKHLKNTNGDEKVARQQTADTIGHTPAVSKKFYLL
jgi:DNA topoisomerase IB